MDHTMIREPAGFAELPKSEQVRYLQALWDRIAEQPDDIPVPESHLALVEERLVRHPRDPEQRRSAYTVLDELTNRPT